MKDADAKSRRRGGDCAEHTPVRGPARPAAAATPPVSVTCFIADEVAMAARMAASAAAVVARACDACGAPIAGEPGGSGLYFWARGEEVRLDEAPLCDACATAITASAHRAWDIEEEEG